MPRTTTPTSSLEHALRRRVAELEAALSSNETLSKTTATLAEVTAERDKLRRAYEQLKGQRELLRRRIFVAKAERIDTRQLELEFAELKAKLVEMAKELGPTSRPSAAPRVTAATGGPRDLRRRAGAICATFPCPRSASRSSTPRSKARSRASASRRAASSATGAAVRSAS